MTKRSRSLVLALAALLVAYLLQPVPLALARDERPQSPAVVDLERLSAEALSELGQARRLHDEPRARCLDRTIAEVHALGRQVREALSRQPSRERMARLLDIWRSRQQALRQRVRRCGRPEPARWLGTIVEVVIAPEVPREDPAELPRRR